MCAQSITLQHIREKYGNDHWALQACLNPSTTIACSFYQGRKYAIYLDPEDCVGFGCVIRYVNDADMASTLDRQYTGIEKKGMASTVFFISDVYQKLVGDAQSMVGFAKDPDFLHWRVFAKNLPKPEYQKDLPQNLIPWAGKNSEKRKWNEVEMASFSKYLKEFILTYTRENKRACSNSGLDSIQV